jgi:hypothetical protein
MSSILLANSFAPLQQSDNPTPMSLATPLTKLAGVATSQTRNSTASFGGSGTGKSSQEEISGLLRSRSKGMGAYPTATSASIIRAQAVPEPAPIVPRPALPEVELPDPLPTSPILQWR